MASGMKADGIYAASYCKILFTGLLSTTFFYCFGLGGHFGGAMNMSWRRIGGAIVGGYSLSDGNFGGARTTDWCDLSLD